MLNISGSRGTTFIRCCLAIATSLGTSDVMGRRSTHPITGITDKVYFRLCVSGLWPTRAYKSRPYTRKPSPYIRKSRPYGRH
jgi:hypothetical protein